MARHKDVDWNLPASGRDEGLTWEHAKISVLMDIRDELKAINRRLNCVDTLRIPYTLRMIQRNTAKTKRKKR